MPRFSLFLSKIVNTGTSSPKLAAAHDHSGSNSPKPSGEFWYATTRGWLSHDRVSLASPWSRLDLGLFVFDLQSRLLAFYVGMWDSWTLPRWRRGSAGLEQEHSSSAKARTAPGTLLWQSMMSSATISPFSTRRYTSLFFVCSLDQCIVGVHFSLGLDFGYVSVHTRGNTTSHPPRNSQRFPSLSITTRANP